MLNFYINGGIFMHLVLLAGLGTMVLNALNFRGEPHKGKLYLAFWMIAATFFLGILGTGIGLYVAGTAVHPMTVDKLAKIIGIAMAPTTLAAIFCTLNAVLVGLAYRRLP
jgi:hypothetical protein